jgi:hypothetical protein
MQGKRSESADDARRMLFIYLALLKGLLRRIVTETRLKVQLGRAARPLLSG